MRLNDWLSKYSKTKIAFFAIFLGVLAILYFNPIYDACEAQREVLIQSQKDFIGFVSENSQEGLKKSSNFKRFMESCRSTNTPGGCFELFSQTRRFIYDLKKISLKCFSKLKENQEVKKFLFGMTQLMVFLAWGGAPPEDEYEKFSWFEKEDLYLFCELRESLQFYYPEIWKNFELSLLKSLPLAQSLPKTQSLSKKEIYDLSLLSHSCD